LGERDFQEKVAVLEVAVHDHGSVKLLNNTCMGDLLVVNAARCSFDKEHKEFDETKDTKLIHYLAKHKHLLPFRHPSATLRIHTPLFVLRQLGKHQVGFSWSEVSRRYITTDPKFYLPDKLRKSAKNIKQGSSGYLDDDNDGRCWNELDNLYEDALASYNRMLSWGCCPEQARMILPQSMYTTCVVTGSLLGWHHMVTQRTEEHTQLETQDYARAIGSIMEDLFPVSWNALTQYSDSSE